MKGVKRNDIIVNVCVVIFYEILFIINDQCENVIDIILVVILLMLILICNTLIIDIMKKMAIYYYCRIQWLLLMS